ncbi:unnamed protein product [Trichobilharzia regenti]|nr:unnamed protein product [Trichobilharzia regenti]
MFKPKNLVKNEKNQLKYPIKIMDKSSSNVIYIISCAECLTKYVSNVQITHHKRLSKDQPTRTEANKNLVINLCIALEAIDKNHNIDWNNVCILKSNMNKWKERLTTEYIFIIVTPDTCDKVDSAAQLSTT